MKNFVLVNACITAFVMILLKSRPERIASSWELVKEVVEKHRCVFLSLRPVHSLSNKRYLKECRRLKVQRKDRGSFKN